ncbi:MAG: hypothetical protein WAJ95_06715, partial [Desulfobacterales bacterium]
AVCMWSISGLRYFSSLFIMFIPVGEMSRLRVHEKISSQFWVLKRPAGKAQKRRNIWIFRVFATQLDGMHRRTKCEVIFE